MPRKKDERSVYEKAEAPLAQKLKTLCTDPKALAAHLGCTVQAVNQYKLGTAAPKIENLAKIAQYYHVSVDWLLGLSETSSTDTDIQAAARYLKLNGENTEYLGSMGGFLAGHMPGVWDDIFGSEDFRSTLLDLCEYRRLLREADDALSRGEQELADRAWNEASFGLRISVMASLQRAMNAWDTKDGYTMKISARVQNKNSTASRLNKEEI